MSRHLPFSSHIDRSTVCLPSSAKLTQALFRVVRAVLEFLLFLSFPAALAFAGAMDLFTMTIPNRISIGLIIAFVVAAILAPLGWNELASHVGAGVLMLVIGVAMFSFGLLGGGDAKLLAAAALWFGFEALLQFLVLVSVAGGLLVIAILIYRSLSIPYWLSNQAWAVRLHGKSGGVPYGIAIAIGGLWLYPKTPWLSSLVL
jgi:prepilin peptidase CpaA